MKYNVGDEVFDDLTGLRKKIVGVEFHDGVTPNGKALSCWGIWLEGEDGGRHPWEITRDEDASEFYEYLRNTENI